MGSNPHQLHIYFFPMLAPGHMNPMVDMARQFAAQGVKATIVMTPVNAPLFSKTIERDKQLGVEISIRVIKFPSLEAGLPEGLENLASITSPEMVPTFFQAINHLQQPLENLLEEDRPDCLVAGVLFSWATEIAGKFGIPRLVFHGMGIFPLCVYYNLLTQKPFEGVESDSEDFVVPDLPDVIKLSRKQLPDHVEGKANSLTNIIGKILEAELKCYGGVVNSFIDLEPAYLEYYKKVIGRKAWLIGPVSLCNKDSSSMTMSEQCLNWLNSKNPNSVLYVCFGSMSQLSSAQLLEIAMALEASGQQFIWVVRKEKATEKGNEKWLPEGFEKRIGEKGLILRGWAPQALILDHEAIGGFVTHCGWNSILESVSAGVPMITWPLFVEQFFNEKLVTDVLKIGVQVGGEENCCSWTKDADMVYVKREDIEKAVSRIVTGEEAEEMRRRVRELRDMARKAVQEGGSSYSDLNALLEELRFNRACRS